MEERKIEEAKFHNKLRSKELEKDMGKYRHSTSNRKFYSISRKRIKFVDEFLKKNCTGRKVLDYCCGDGVRTFFLAEHGADAVGIDISSISIQNAKEKALSKGLRNIHFFVMDAENLEFPKNYFDLILCSGVLHHLDIKKAYSELARVLKHDGKIICGEPLVHNPIFQLYRRLTPHLRTKWETKHILNRRDIKLAEKYFGKVEKRFFCLATLFAVPFRNISIIFKPLLTLLEYVDYILLRLPLVKWLAWQIVFILSNPKKQNGGT